MALPFLAMLVFGCWYLLSILWHRNPDRSKYRENTTKTILQAFFYVFLILLYKSTVKISLAILDCSRAEDGTWTLRMDNGPCPWGEFLWVLGALVVFVYGIVPFVVLAWKLRTNANSNRKMEQTATFRILYVSFTRFLLCCRCVVCAHLTDHIFPLPPPTFSRHKTTGMGPHSISIKGVPVGSSRRCNQIFHGR